MATKIKPHKLISTSITSAESGGLKFPSSVNKSVYSITTSFNQIGKTLEGIGKTTESIRDIVVARGTWLENQLNETKRLSDYKRDQEAEIEAEGGTQDGAANDETEDETEKLVKKQKGPLDWLEKFIKPFENLIAWVSRTFISAALFKWFSDPKNLEKMENIFKTLYDIGNFVFKLVTFSIGAILDGLAGIFGGADKLKNGNLGGAWDMFKGVGLFITGIVSLKAISYLLNPFGLINDIMMLMDMQEQAQNARDIADTADMVEDAADANKARKVAQTPEDLQKAYKLKSLEQAEELDRLIKASGQTAESLSDDAMQALVKQARRNKPAGLLGKAFAGAENLVDNVFKSLGDFKNFLGDKAKFYKDILVEKTQEMLAKQRKRAKGLWAGITDFGAEMYARMKTSAQKTYENTLNAAKKGWQKAGDLGNALKKKAGDSMNYIQNGFDNLAESTKKLAQNAVIEPLKKPFEPLLNKIKGFGDAIMSKFLKTPVGSMMQDYLVKKGLSITKPGPLLKKIGGKALPIIGGLVNLLFAADRLASGDVIGAGMEFASAGFDLSGAFGFAPGPGISLGMDIFLLLRDLIPGMRQLEDGLIENLGLKPLVDGMNNFFSKFESPITMALKAFSSGPEEGEEEKSEGGGLDSKKGNSSSIAAWQNRQEIVEPKNLRNVLNPAESIYRAAGWMGFSAGGVMDKYKNGEVPRSEMKKVKGYAGWGKAGSGILHKSVADKFQSMLDAAKKDGNPIGINDTYRTYADQVYMKKTKGYLAATPGTSNHGYGLAADLNYFDKGYKWLWANAGKFGFKPLKGWGLSPNTPNKAEAWHWENLTGAGTANANVKTNTEEGGNVQPQPELTPEQMLEKSLGMLTRGIMDVRKQMYGDESITRDNTGEEGTNKSLISPSNENTGGVNEASTSNALNESMKNVDNKGKSIVPITLPVSNTQLINTGSDPVVVFKGKGNMYPTDK
jgi:hypothetical protein